MFSLFYGCYEFYARKEELHLLVIGLDKSGKTTMLEKLKSLYTDLPGTDPNKVLPTVGLNIGRFQAVHSSLVFWDLGGQAGLRSIWDKYYSEAHGLIFVVDASEPQRFDEAKQALDRALGE
jgi:ADP-ribosylation factor related protein 1